MQGAAVRTGSLRLYEVLGVSVQASATEIKAGFRRMAITFHPDKNKDPSAADRFKEVSLAYEVLSDAERRELYDAAGEASLQEGFDPSFFLGRKRSRRRTEDLVHALEVTLEDLYGGKIVQLAQNRKIICTVCSGKGTSPASIAAAPCRVCLGARFTVSVQPMGPGLVHHVQAACRACNASGVCDLCPKCAGSRVSTERRVISVPVARGMNHNQRIVLSGEADEAPDATTGDVIIILNQRPHARFRREGDDLHLSHEISLRDALCGLSVRVTHLDGRVLVVKNVLGDVVSPGTARCIEGEGMPEQSNPLLHRGRLFMHFNVLFPPPSSLSPAALVAIASLLPSTNPVAPSPSITTSPTAATAPNEEEVIAVPIAEPQTSQSGARTDDRAGGCKQS